MRDALSILDQCLSFGDGTVTAARVREVLGLVGDELYAELLELVAGRNPAGVFPLVDRLVDAGADLVEFMGGAGEALRALLQIQLGSVPEGLTEALRQALERNRDRLQPGDVLRMLKLLTESEAAVRRSGNPRLVAETLLLRWAMMDRMVDLAEVLSAGQRGGGAGGQVSAAAVSGGAPPAPAPMPSGPAPEPPGAAVAFPPSVPAALAAAWPAIVSEVRGRSRFLGEALAATTPAQVENGVLAVVLVEPNPLFAERLQTQAPVVEEVIRRLTGQVLRLRVTEAQGEAAAPRPRTRTEAGIKADRLKGFRAKDPSLDTAADALDLEIVD
jgi:DNA polymerase-3 subunit gamma/tau